MTLTLDRLREMPADELSRLRGDDLADARKLVRDAQNGAFDSMDRIMKAAGARSLTAAQQRDYDAADAELGDLRPLLDVLDDAVARSTVDRRGVVPNGKADGEYRDGVPLSDRQSFAGFARARDLIPEGDEDLSLQKALRGVVLGEWQGAHREFRAMTEGTQSAGGYLLPTVLSSQIIDLARNQTRVMQAGARIFPMTNRTVDVAKWVSDPSMAWHTEAATISPSDAVIGTVRLTAQTLPGLTLLSRELLEDATGVDDELRQAFAAVLAMKVDQVALYGTGTPPEPHGVKGTSGVLTASMGANGAAFTNWDPVVDAVGTLRDNNEDPTAAIFSPRSARALAKLKDTTNQPLAAPGYLDGVPRYETNQVPNNLTQGSSSLASDMFVADWRQLYVGVRTNLQITVLSERYADTGQIGLLAWWRGDIAVARPKAFHVTSGVL